MRSKVVILSAIICFSALSLCAQNGNNRYHTFGSEGPRQFKGFFGPLVALSNVEGNFSIDVGATGGIIIYKRIILGFYGQTMISRPPRTNLAIIGYPSFTGGEIRMIQGGAVLGYIHKPEDEIHWGISSSAGLGILSLYAKDPSMPDKEQIYDDRVYIVIPKFFVELNMTKWFKVNMSAGYRVVGKVNGIYTNSQTQEIIPTFYKSGYTKPEFSVALLFGTFGKIKSLLD